MREFSCPGCRKTTLREGNPYRPFCSKRCQMLDLGAWLGETYVIPGDPTSPLESGADFDREPSPAEGGEPGKGWE
jgi:uncharacterized protein